MKLLIDMGNSRLKWAVSTNGTVQQSGALANTELTPQNLHKAWAAVQPQAVYIACVSASPLLALVKSVAAHLWQTPEIVQVKSTARAFGVQNAYQHAEKLGIDRWLALIAARHYYTGAVCIIDCGTAITVDVLDAHGIHQGGLISAGLGLMQKALNAHTQQLPSITADIETPAFALATNTRAAIAQGTLTAAVGLIEQLARQLNTQNSLFLLTGGDAMRISSQLNLPVIIDSDLVLRGLALVTAENKA